MPPIQPISEVQSLSMKQKIETDVRRKNIKTIATSAGIVLGATGVVLLSAHCIRKGKLPIITEPIKKYHKKFVDFFIGLYKSNRFINKTVDNVLKPVYQSFKELPKYIKFSLNIISQVMTIKALYDIFKNNELKQVADNFIDKHKAKSFAETTKVA